MRVALRDFHYSLILSSYIDDLRIKSVQDTVVLQFGDLVKYEHIPTRVTSFDQASPSYRLSTPGRKLLQAFDVASIGNEAVIIADKTAYDEAFRRSAITIEFGRVGLAGHDQHTIHTSFGYKFRVQAGNDSYLNNGFTISLSTDRWDGYICHMRR
jgi:hypothetical protein